MKTHKKKPAKKKPKAKRKPVAAREKDLNTVVRSRGVGSRYIPGIGYPTQ